MKHASSHNKYHNPRIDKEPNSNNGCANTGSVYFDIGKSTWVITMLLLGTVGSALTISTGSVLLFLVFTSTTLCLGHSLGMHRRFIHRSYQCPKWLEVFFTHLGTLVGLDGPLGMLRTHDLRDWAQRQNSCHDYFSHSKPWYQDAYWQIFCSIKLDNPPLIDVEPEIANDKIYELMQHSWMLQQVPWAILFYLLGGWGWVCWGICSRVSVSILGHWFVGYLAHNNGQRNWHVSGAAVQGHNIVWASLLTGGKIGTTITMPSHIQPV